MAGAAGRPELHQAPVYFQSFKLLGKSQFHEAEVSAWQAGRRHPEQRSLTPRGQATKGSQGFSALSLCQNL